VRGGTRLGGLPSIAAAGVHVAARSLPGGLAGQPVVVLGAGAVARSAVEALLLQRAQVQVLNRTPEHAHLAFGHLGERVPLGGLDALPAALAGAALVIGATASRQPVVELACVEAALAARERHNPLLLLDIAVPRDVDPRVRSLPGARLIDLDDLERECPLDVAARRAELERAEQLATAEAERLGRWLRSRAAGPAITQLRGFAEEIRATELRRSAPRLKDLTPEQIAAVEALTAGIVNKLLHGPTVALRDAALRPAGLSRSRLRILRVLRPARARRSA
jgi:glutamyl-tRNA reductase